MESFHPILQSQTPLLFDGAIGTELYKRGIFINRCFESVHLGSEDLLLNLHQEYIAQGSQIITTNTWGANRLKLKEHNFDDKIALINLKACEIAKKASQDRIWIAGSVGPLGVRIEPFGPTSYTEAKALFSEQMRYLKQGGVDLITLETFLDLSELGQAIEAAREICPELPIIAHVTINEEYLTPYGTPLEWVVKKLDSWGVDAMGLNCSIGPQLMLSCVEKIKVLTNTPLSVRPNAGLPKQVEGRQIYMSTPEYFAHFTKEFLQAGVQFIGGCCGSAPEHIKAMANVMRYAKAMSHSQKINSAPKDTTYSTSSDTQIKSALEGERVPFAQKSKWSQNIALGKKVFSVELLPPAGIDPSVIIDQSRKLKAAGIDAINIPDGPRASARMSAILTAVMIEQQAEIETVLHYTCRDRNLLGMQSDLLGAQSIGLRNLLLVTGDPPKLGHYPNATGVFDVDAIGLTNMVHRLNGGIDLGGRSIGKPASFSIGVGVNPVHRDFEYEMGRFIWKVDAGAEWAITQPVFDVESLYRFLDVMHSKSITIPIIAGVWPLTSFRNALFMKNEVPGVVIPDKVLERMSKAENADDARKVGVEIAHEMLSTLSSSVQGFQVSAPFGRIEMALAVIG